MARTVSSSFSMGAVVNPFLIWKNLKNPDFAIPGTLETHGVFTHSKEVRIEASTQDILFPYLLIWIFYFLILDVKILLSLSHFWLCALANASFDAGRLSWVWCGRHALALFNNLLLLPLLPRLSSSSDVPPFVLPWYHVSKLFMSFSLSRSTTPPKNASRCFNGLT